MNCNDHGQVTLGALGSRLGFARRCADLRHDGVDDRSIWRRISGSALLRHAYHATIERDGPNVPADERVSFGALAETDRLPPRRCPPCIADWLQPLVLTISCHRPGGCCIVAVA